MVTVRIDLHAHLYDSYPLQAWCNAAARNLHIGPGVSGIVVVVDRAGQDSFQRFRDEVPSFGVWLEAKVQSPDNVSEAGMLSWEGKTLLIIRGVQYVSVERIEVLGLGVARSVPDGAPLTELVDLIRREDGIPCIPWSPGKWLGRRGQVISRVMGSFSPGTLTFGDITIRSVLGPPSLLLQRARKNRFAVLLGTDSLPRVQDATLVALS